MQKSRWEKKEFKAGRRGEACREARVREETALMVTGQEEASQKEDGRARQIGRSISNWFVRSQRDLPWRKTTDPWAILVSETMLQQTRVETVIPFYVRFMAACPRPSTLAALSEDEVHRLWQGLGYYSRARNLQRAAVEIAGRHKDQVPCDVTMLRALPGVGPYTSAAVRSIAFGIPEAAVDGNVLRVTARLECDYGDIALSGTRDRYRDLVQLMIPEDAASAFCQGMMELGATTCTPKHPKCMSCPVADVCRARAAGLAGTLPVKSAKPKPVDEKRFVLIIRDGDRLLFERRGEGLLAGMFGLPCVQSDSDMPDADLFEGTSGIIPNFKTRIGTVTHVFTHRRWRMEAWLATLADPAATGSFGWHPIDRLAELPVPKAFRKVLDLAASYLRGSE